MKLARLNGRWTVELPQHIVDEYDFNEGDDIDVLISFPQMLEWRQAKKRAAAIAAIRDLRVPLPDDYRFKRSDAYEDGRG